MYVIFDRDGLVYGVTADFEKFKKGHNLVDVEGRDGGGSLNSVEGRLRYTYAYGPTI